MFSIYLGIPIDNLFQRQFLEKLKKKKSRFCFGLGVPFFEGPSLLLSPHPTMPSLELRFRRAVYIHATQSGTQPWNFRSTWERFARNGGRGKMGSKELGDLLFYFGFRSISPGGNHSRNQLEIDALVTRMALRGNGLISYMELELFCADDIFDDEPEADVSKPVESNSGKSDMSLAGFRAHEGAQRLLPQCPSRTACFTTPPKQLSPQLAPDNLRCDSFIPEPGSLSKLGPGSPAGAVAGDMTVAASTSPGAAEVPEGAQQDLQEGAVATRGHDGAPAGQEATGLGGHVSPGTVAGALAAVVEARQAIDRCAHLPSGGCPAAAAPPATNAAATAAAETEGAARCPAEGGEGSLGAARLAIEEARQVREKDVTGREGATQVIFFVVFVCHGSSTRGERACLGYCPDTDVVRGY